MPLKTESSRRQICVLCLRRRDGRHLLITSNRGVTSWPRRMIQSSSNDSSPALSRETRIWAKAAPVLALGVVNLRFALNAKDNRAAVHDLGLAAGNLLLEATVRGLFVHQMIGILPDKAREIYGIPEGFEAWTGLAIGYKGDPTSLPARLRERDLAPRQRKQLREFVFSGKWENPSPLVLGGDAEQ